MSAAASKFTAKEKADAIERELGYRRRNYPRWVAAGTMSQALADKQIALFEEIFADMRRAAETAEPQGKLL